jgi:UDP-glucose 4-epimerase
MRCVPTQGGSPPRVQRTTRPQTVLVTGATGYLGSHTCVALLAAGYAVVGIDNFSNSCRRVLERIDRVAGRPILFCEGDVRDAELLRALFDRQHIDAAIHFAGLKAVGESCSRPLDYYEVNVGGSLVLAQAMRRAGARRLVFSSSATVYGQPEAVPVGEAAELRPLSPYGRSKWMTEQILQDVASANEGWSVMLLRYFNPVGAHPSGLLGEDPSGVPNNLMPFLTQIAAGRRDYLNVLGRDYPTPDGTGVRDYIHVMDLARGHVAALIATEAEIRPGVCQAINLGTGRGYSVLEIVEAFRKVSGHPIPVRFAPRRAGDVASTFADVSRASTVLDWTPQLSLEDMCRDAWNWQSRNPAGYRGISAIPRKRSHLPREVGLRPLASPDAA